MSILNRRAKFDYDIKETYIAGLVLESNEVKPLRQGKVSIQSSFINEKKGEIFINNFEIISIQKNFDEKKKIRTVKKLLLNKREIKKILGLLTTKGFTAVPMEIFFNEKGLAKVKFGVGVGKKNYDKRESIKQREWSRKKERILRK
ncbi:SsrA-binding protein SmpB [Alphaproteobacteria bacterium]|nr:SsrA-binding protein SmpB [Alphaproteobacteria bacterium]MDA8695001.1 SsrA-binding protein SmpB [Alphaproteobacteria bacterium]MDB0034394.1 SsrA-binding protein SmpB [Alphaproteobacteria bacterium]